MPFSALRRRKRSIAHVLPSLFVIVLPSKAFPIEGLFLAQSYRLCPVPPFLVLPTQAVLLFQSFSILDVARCVRDGAGAFSNLCLIFVCQTAPFLVFELRAFWIGSTPSEYGDESFPPHSSHPNFLSPMVFIFIPNPFPTCASGCPAVVLACRKTSLSLKYPLPSFFT